MIDAATYLRVLTPESSSELLGIALIEPVRFENPELAWKRLLALTDTHAERVFLSRAMPALLAVLEEAATPDLSLLNLDRFLRSVRDRERTLQFLAENPRAVEILVRLFVGSHYLTEVLLQNPEYLERLTQHNRLAEIKSRQQFFAEGLQAIESAGDWNTRINLIKHFQKREMLRIAACDTFGLMDFKVTTLQLSLLADSIVQLVLRFACEDLGIAAPDLCVLAMGKLGGEELNYSSDIDLVFVCDSDGAAYAALAQRLIRGLSEMTSTGFLYRVDMRLRPWGRAGALVTTRQAYLDYIRKDGRLWEKQALLKARPIAGDFALGYGVLKSLQPLIFQVDPEVAQSSIRAMKREIEAKLAAQNLLDSEIKGGLGGIRDIEFVVQYLQLVTGADNPSVPSFNTLDGIVRLAEHDIIQADEYRQLTGGYVFLRTVEHALQLLNNKQEHTLPRSERELAYLARRIDFPGAKEFMTYHDRHRTAIRRIFAKYIEQQSSSPTIPISAPSLTQQMGGPLSGYAERFSGEQQRLHLQLLESLGSKSRVKVHAASQPGHRWELTIVGYDEPGELSVICGLLLLQGMDIESGDVFTGRPVGGPSTGTPPHRKFIDVLQIRARGPLPERDFWAQFEFDLASMVEDVTPETRVVKQGRLARRVAGLIEFEPDSVSSTLLPLVIEVDHDLEPDVTVLRISGDDTIGFLYELTNALTLCGILIQRVTIRTTGELVSDTLYVTDEHDQKITDPGRLRELQTAVILIKHFTHLLPQSPNPEAALQHFRELLQRLFSSPDWSEQVASLDRTEVLGALSKLLGVSDFLGEELLRQDLGQVMPIVTNTSLRSEARTQSQLELELAHELAHAQTLSGRRVVLNAFKDREMLRVDMRHILGHQESFAGFASELTDIAEVTLRTALRICEQELLSKHGRPQRSDGQLCRMSICALGKCAGRELGFASDIELMFLYEDAGHSSGPEPISNEEYFDRLIDLFLKSIHSRRKGIFEIDLRLRPHGKAGSRAVTVENFRRYFSPGGAAWPFERQSLVKLRPIAGETAFGEEVLALRDQMIYTGQAFDVAAMRALRDKQIRQLVTPDTFNAKLSPGGLVDIEYLVQGLQLIHGGHCPSVRTPNTREAMKALEVAGVLTAEQRLGLREAYRFMRRLIDALRMVRGDAMDLAVPPRHSDEYRFLTRRMQLFKDSIDLAADIESYSSLVQELSRILLPDAAR